MTIDGRSLTIEEAAIWLSKAVIKLDKHDFIQTFDETEEMYCENLRGAAVYYAKKIQELVLKAEKEERGDD